MFNMMGGGYGNTTGGGGLYGNTMGGGGGYGNNGYLRTLLAQMMAQQGQQGPTAPAQAMQRPQMQTPGQEFWASGGQGNPNKRVPIPTAPMTHNDWSLANQGYFAPMGGPDFRYGVGEGGKPAAAPGGFSGGKGSFSGGPGSGGGMVPPAAIPPTYKP